MNDNKPIELACIIDDDKIYVSLVKRIIESKNLSRELLIFSNGKEALDYFEKVFNGPRNIRVPNIILLDLNMPVMDGWQFLEHFMKIEKRHQKVITLYIVSSSIDPNDVAKAHDLSSVSGYIIKPVMPKELETLFKQEVD
ncbi:response regulator [Ascidiimonas aurantiaca]|uniref:response regulator n=1 Tax=Ascidiimonas aurantiaca TaxID=1685432 RepID=UPI0030EE4BDC